MSKPQDRRHGGRRAPILGALAASLLLWTAVPSAAATAPPPFRRALDAHLAAVQAKDLRALVPTLTRGPELTMIAPNGLKFDTRQQYVDFHRQWFATQDDGRFESEVIRVVESPALAHALVRYRYSSRSPAGVPQVSTSWLTLTFALEEGRWRLVFDQNTAIGADAAP